MSTEVDWKADFRHALEAIVGARGVVPPEESGAFTRGARYGVGAALNVVKPETVEQVQAIVRLCARNSVRLLSQGANTGLTGASTPDASGNQLVVSMARMRSVCDIRPLDRTVTVDAGMTLSELNEKLASHGLRFPIDLGADPQIGGMIATNTGGSRLIRFGDVRRHVLALEAVLFDPQATAVRLGRGLRKDNTGFDLKQPLIGTSGAAGVITSATLALHPLPQQSATALVAPTSNEAALELLRLVESELGDFLSSFEGMSAEAVDAAVGHVPGLRMPFGTARPGFTLLIELESSSRPDLTGLDLQTSLTEFLARHYGTLVEDAVVDRGEGLWKIRHSISEGLRHLGMVIAFDISVPRARIMEFRDEARRLVHTRWPALRVADFGHVADGGLHFNLVIPNEHRASFSAESIREIRATLYELVVVHYDGSFSAEHGVGPHNIEYYRRHTEPALQALAGRMQRLFDPGQISASIDFGPDAQPAFTT